MRLRALLKTSSIGLNMEDFNTHSRLFPSINKSKKDNISCWNCCFFSKQNMLFSCLEHLLLGEKKSKSSTLYTSVPVKAALKSLNESRWAHPRVRFRTYLVFHPWLKGNENCKLKITTICNAIHDVVWDV